MVEETIETEEGTNTTNTNKTVSVGTPIVTWIDKNSPDLRFNYYIEYSSEFYYDIPYNTY